jgi:ring-1,2-phenylacetyl-CoA epoxidase subunit PaaE
VTPIITRRLRRRPVFHRLAVHAVDRLTADAVAITFAVPPELRESFAFRAGQHLTVRRATGCGGDEVRRSYSICSTPAELAAHGRLRIGVREIPAGVFSAFAVRNLRAGDTVDVLPPLGQFTTAFDPGRARHYGAVVAGSGITPVLGLVATGLAVEAASTFTLVYGNRTVASVMFVDELADLKDRYPVRLHLVHVLSREPGAAPLLSGRIDADRLTRLLASVVPAERIDEWFICGPYGMVTEARSVLAAAGVADRAVHTELFHVDGALPPVRRAADTVSGAGVDPGAGTSAEVTITLDGRSTSFQMGRGERVLDAALRARGELPYACKGGVCSTCRAKVVSGAVTMARNYALEPDELAAGYVLTCQSSPTTDQVVIDYDA